ncbi:endonuclease/exonuclease/phosphatase family protein [Kribbella amoyensis]|nr:endonuclease/exonuclease/phosphatase family protein [Kribbella amoyensis]
MTWNVWWRFGPAWRDRQAGILTTLRRLEPDLVGLQESWRTTTSSQARQLGDALGLHSAYAGPSLPPRPDPAESPDQEGVELGLALLSRWPIRSVRRVLLPARHRFRPTTLLATIDHPRTPFQAVVTCTEWEPAYADDHLAQTQALAALVGSLPQPAVLLGDLNAAPDSEELRPLLAVSVDTWAEGSGEKDAVTLSSRHPEAPVEATKQLDRRIDYVLTSSGGTGQRFWTEGVFLVGEPVGGVFPSDHFAVVTDLAPW